MNILSIETSCDETAVSVVKAEGDFPDGTYTVLGDALFSQIDIHKEYGGVFPALAKREHIKTLIPMATKALSEAGLYTEEQTQLPQEKREYFYTTLHHEEGFADALIDFFEQMRRPNIDLIAVTAGPGLEPALWVGINFAKVLSTVWDIPLVGVNHMDGHILASLFDGSRIQKPSFPALSLLISGGHTELIVSKSWDTFEKIGQTRDDALGEAFDKVARMLNLPYPGGPQISKLAEEARKRSLTYSTYFDSPLPRPMVRSEDLDFSFSGIKTAVRYAIEGKDLEDEDLRCAVAREFEDAVTEVLVAKVRNAIDTHGIQSFILGGGVSANSTIREALKGTLAQEYPDLLLFFPNRKLSTDNGIMIALAGHAHASEAQEPAVASAKIKADGNRSITEESIK